MAKSKVEEHQLEPVQYERLYFEEDIPLRDITRGLGPKLLVLGLILFAASVIISNVVKYPDQIELPFVLRGNEREINYAFPFPVYVKDVFVKPGQQVEEGAPLISLSSPEIASLIADLDSRSARKETFESFTGSSYGRQADILDKQIQQLRVQADQLNKQMDLLEQQWTSHSLVLEKVFADAESEWTAAQKLFAEGVISKFEYQDKERSFVQAKDNRSNREAGYRRERLALQTELEEAKQGISSSVLEKSKLDFDKAALLGDLKSDITSAGQQIETIFDRYKVEDGAVILLSPGALSVSFIHEGDGEIHEGSTVLKLNQTSRADYAFIKCPPSAAGKVKDGMKVNLKVSSFPYYEWGVVEGVVETKSISPDENGSYNMQVRLGHQNRLEGMLFPGLDGTALIVLEEKTLFQYFFRNLSKAYHSAAGK